VFYLRKEILFLIFLVEIIFIYASRIRTLALTRRTIFFKKRFILRLLRVWMVYLTVLILVLCTLASFLIAQKNENFLFFLIITLTRVRLIFFSLTSVLKFYLFFELSLLPILFIIIGWGYQFERLKASKAIIIYTIFGSAPLLILVIIIKINLLMTLWQLNSFIRSFNFRGSLGRLLRLAFLVKLPIFLFHIWLPKAHVEAPVVGSIFLAAVLLKLGGYGLIKFNYVNRNTNNFRKLILRIRLVSCVLVNLICVQILDIKIIIALSSVAHIRIALSLLINNFYNSVICRILIFFTHGFSSSLIFFNSYILYLKSNTRRLLLNKSFFNISRMFMLFWVLGSLGIIGAPPSFNLWVEIIRFLTLIIRIKIFITFLFWRAFLTGAYSFIIIRVAYHAREFSLIKQKENFSLLVQLICLNHIFWIIFFVFITFIFFV